MLTSSDLSAAVARRVSRLYRDERGQFILRGSAPAPDPPFVPMTFPHARTKGALVGRDPIPNLLHSTLADSSETAYLRIPFTDTLPFSAQRPHTALADRDMAVTQEAGIGVYWDFARVASGGYGDSGYVDYFWDGEGVGQTRSGGWGDIGYPYNPNGSGAAGSASWPETLYCRFRMYPVTGIQNAETIVRTFKWFIWHDDGVQSGERILIILEPGSNGPGSETDASHVCVGLNRNIINAERLVHPIPVGEWSHVQMAWSHGAASAASLKIWRNNNNPSSPSASLIGFASDWPRDHDAYDGPWKICSCSNQGCTVSPTFNYRVQDFEVGPTFDSTWAP